MRFPLFIAITLFATSALLAAPFHPIDRIDPPAENEYPGGRGPGQLILYTPEAGRAHTGTNEWGVEAVVVQDVVIRIMENNNEIPEDGFVVSGNETSARWIGENLSPGTPVRIEEENGRHVLHVDESPAAIHRSLLVRLELLDDDPHFPAGDEAAAAKASVTEKWLHAMAEAGEYGTLAEARTLVEELEELATRNRLGALPSPESEIRGFWSRLPVYTEEEIVVYVEELAKTGVNVFFPEVVYGSQAAYHDPTGLYPMWGHFDEDIDPLEIVIRECHARGIEVHAWVHCFFIGTQLRDAHLAERYSEWLAQDRTGSQVSEVEPYFMYFSPSHPEVREALIEAYVALVENYDIDGFQFDYIRYPRPESWEDQWDYSPAARDEARQNLGFDPMDITPDENPEEWDLWMDWRAEVITSFVREASEAIRAVRPDIVLTADVFHDPDDAFKYRGQDWPRWAREGLVDAIIPMAYRNSADYVAGVVERARDLLPGDHPMIIGLGPYLGFTAEELTGQIEAVREAGATGQVLFSLETTNPRAKEALGLGPWRNRTAPVWDRE